MAAGEFDRVVLLKTPTVTRDSRGGAEKSFATVAPVWAKVSEERAKDKIANDKRTSFQEAIFKIRWRDDVTEDMVIEHDGKDYGIVSVVELGRRHNLEILAKEGVL